MISLHLKSRGLALSLAAGLLALPTLALATPTLYHVSLTTLNNSGVTGMATLSLDNNMLMVHIIASGLMPNMMHMQHIHGTFDSANKPSQAVLPTLAANDTNGDGVISVGEGAAAYGDILIDLSSPPGGGMNDFPTAPTGKIDFTQIYDLTNSTTFNAPYGKNDVFPLTFREIVLHGLDVPINLTDGGTMYEKGQYDPLLPVAAGVIQAGALPVPEPSSIVVMLAGLGTMLALVGLGRRRKRHGMAC